MKPLLPDILVSYSIPSMLLSEKDVEDFENDPIEFMRKERDPNPNIYSVRNSILESINHIIKYKSSEEKDALPEFLANFFQYCLENLSEYMKQDNPDFRIKDALVTCIGKIASTLLMFDQFNENLELILREAVFQDLLANEEVVRPGKC